METNFTDNIRPLPSVKRRSNEYRGHDFWTKERHDFVRVLNDSQSIRRGIDWSKLGDLLVFWTVCGIIAGAFLWYWLPIIVAAYVRT